GGGQAGPELLRDRPGRGRMPRRTSPDRCRPRPTTLRAIDYAASSPPLEGELLMAAPMTLNERALRLADHMAANAAALRIDVQTTAGGARVLDCGVKAEGGLQAGLGL